MRIGLVAACPFPSPQGSQVFVAEMAGKLVAAGHEVHLLSYGQGADFRCPGVTHHRIRRLLGDRSMRSGPSAVKPLLDLLLAVRLWALIRRHRLELLHAHNYEAALVALAARGLSRIPLVYHSHNLLADELPQYFSGRVGRAVAARAGAYLDRTIPRRTDHVIALCQWSAARLLRAGVEEGRMSVLPPAVDDPGRAEGEPEPGLIAYSGNLDAYQNLGLLLDAFALLARTHKRARLVLISHGADKELALRVRRCKGVELVRADGFADAHRRMCRSALLVLPRREGSGVPIKLLNYLASARPIVAAGCGAKLLENGRDCLLVPDDDAEAMAAAMARLLDDPAEARAIGRAGRLRYETDLGWGNLMKGLEAAYQKACRVPSGRLTGTAAAGTAKLGAGPTGAGARER